MRNRYDTVHNQPPPPKPSGSTKLAMDPARRELSPLVPVVIPRAATSTKPRSRSSDPDLYKIWCELYLQYFPQRADLANYQVIWANNKRKRTLASCNLRRLKVTVASELRHEKHYQWLSPLLYHEMCHAVLHFEVGRNSRGMRWHGPEFKRLESLHPQIEALNHWAKNGGWLGAIRSDRARRSHQKRSIAERSSATAAMTNTKIIRKIRISSKSSSNLSQASRIVVRRPGNPKLPAQTPAGQFLLFLRDIKRKLTGQ